ncbi:MAG: hypothetical protein HQ523_05770 [Lentisphaerae bacterium]|nr:hypothetical protein [Lentisphaerota bacterium]
MSHPPHSILDAAPTRVRELLDCAAAETLLWSTDDLRDVFDHQWATPLAMDLGGLGQAMAEQVETLAVSKQLLLRSFGDLLEHERPPLALLQLSKEFAKRCLHSPHSTIPHDVARVLYFTTIAAALSRCGQRISSLSDARILEGIAWSLDCDWLAEKARTVLRSGQQTLTDRGRQS